MKKAKRILLLSALFVMTSGMYQNWIQTRAEKFIVSPISEDIRNLHAREIFGKSFFKSKYNKIKDRGVAHIKLYDLVREELPKEYKPKAIEITQALISESQKYQLDPFFVAALIKTESKFNPKAVGSAGEIGLMQLKPATAKWLSSKKLLGFRKSKDLYSPTYNIKVGTAYMAYLRTQFKKEPSHYITAYNAGQNNKNLVRLSLRSKSYQSKVLSQYKSIYAGLMSPLVTN